MNKDSKTLSIDKNAYIYIYTYIYIYINKQTNNCVARVLNTNVEQIVSIYREQIKLTQVSNY